MRLITHTVITSDQSIKKNIIMYIRRKRVSVKRRKGPYRKRNFKRRGRVSRPISVGVPNYRYAKLQYCDQIGGSIPASLSIASVYSSSAFDPYFPFGGHQPMFYDQYAAMYQRYTVMGVGYNIDISMGDTSNIPIYVTLTYLTTSAPPTSLNYVRERSGSKETIVSSAYKARLKGYMSVKKVLGISSRQLATDDQYSALINADIPQRAFLHIQAWNQSTTAISNLSMSFRLTYYIKFWQPQEPLAS